MMKEILQRRMEQLDFSQYRLTQEVCKLRAEGDEIPPVSRYQSSIRKAITDPQHVKLYIIQDMVKALDGEIIIRWNNREEVKAS